MDNQNNRSSPFAVLDPEFSYQQNIDHLLIAPDTFVDNLFSQLSPEEQRLHDSPLLSSLYSHSNDDPLSHGFASSTEYANSQSYFTQQPTLQNHSHLPPASNEYVPNRNRVPTPTDTLSVNIDQISIANAPPNQDWLLASPDQSTPGHIGNRSVSGDESDGNSSVSSQKPANPKRRKAHNVIEKRYRLSINQRIEELKQILAPEQSKMSKSATLKMALEHIAQLRSENEYLKQQLHRTQPQLYINSQTPTTLMDTSPSSAPSSSGSPTPQPPPKQARRSRNHDGNKLLLLAVLMGWVLFNPLQSLIPGATNQQELPTYDTKHTGKVLLNHAALVDSEIESSWFDDGVFRFLCLWLLNGLVVMFVLARLLIFGEPVNDTKQASCSLAIAKRLNAQSFIQQKKPLDAYVELSQSLSVLACPLPIGLYEELSSVVWQTCRHLLNLCYIGHWVPDQRDKLFKGKRVQEATQEAAQVFSLLNSIQLEHGHRLGHSKLQQISVALCAINFSELSKQSTSRLYILAAVQCKLLMGDGYLHKVLSRYFLLRASRTADKCNSWIFSKSGLEFWSSLEPTRVQSILSSSRDKVANAAQLFDLESESTTPDLLTTLFTQYKMFTMEEIVRILVHGTDATEYDRALTLSEVLLAQAGHDTSLSWLANVAVCACFWGSDQHQTNVPSERYDQVRRIPAALLTNPLAMAVGHAFCCRKLCQEHKHQKQYERVVFTHVRKAVDFLNTQGNQGSRHESELETLLRSLCYDWLLSSCTDVWMDTLSSNRPYWTQPVTRTMLCFQHDLLHLYEQHTLSQTVYAAHDKLKLYLHRTCLLMRAGRQPILTWQALQLCAQRPLSHAHTERMLSLAQLHHDTPPGF